MDTARRQPYPSDLTDAEWAIIEPLLPPPVPAGAPRKTPFREVIDAISYVLTTGCAWKALPHDFRTPEGSYRLERRNARSDYFLSIKVSYPNEADLKRAHAHHWDTGGSIMIHGLPNYLKHEPDYYQNHDWTDGCIAVSNADMTEIWMLIPDDVPIDILP